LSELSIKAASKEAQEQDSDSSNVRNTAMSTTDIALLSATVNEQARLPACRKFTYIQLYVHQTHTPLYTHCIQTDVF